MALRAFTKMHGAGNDFVVFDATSLPLALTPEQVCRIADRHLGIGCDQVLVVEPARETGTDFYYRIFNADGGEVEQCGNGARCFARFVHDHGLSTKQEIRVGTLSGVIVPRLEADGRVTVDMGAPVLDPQRIPFTGGSGASTEALDVGGRRVEITAVSMGNPHAVQVVADVESAPVASEGAAITTHARFPRGANAGYMEVLGRGRVRLRVYERGAGETLACGTGACAAVVAGVLRGLLDASAAVTVSTRGGDLGISWQGAGKPVYLTGPAVAVFEGELELTT